MRRGLVYALILTAALLIPNEDVELAKMKPVEILSLRYQEGSVILETDTEDVGVGETVDEAIENLKATTAGRIYLDTTVYLLVSPEAVDEISKLTSQLKGNARLCMRTGEVDLKNVGEYLREHTPKVKLKDWQKGVSLQLLETENGRMKLN